MPRQSGSCRRLSLRKCTKLWSHTRRFAGRSWSRRSWRSIVALSLRSELHKLKATILRHERRDQLRPANRLVCDQSFVHFRKLSLRQEPLCLGIVAGHAVKMTLHVTVLTPDFFK